MRSKSFCSQSKHCNTLLYDMVAEVDVCDSVAGFPGRPDEVLNKDMQVARCRVVM